jgi:uncharacterized protein (TIGR02284 family)
MENRAQPADPAPVIFVLPRSSTTLGKVLMSTDEGKLNEMKLALKSLINVLQDSQKDFADLGEHLKDETLKKFFLTESLKRANFRGELENELHRAGVHDVHETGTTTGAFQRVWGDLKAHLASGDHQLLVTAEKNEDTVKAAYSDALDRDLPLPLRQLLVEQQADVLASHDLVKSQRDTLVGK